MLSVHEDDDVLLWVGEKVFGGCGAACAGGEVVEEADATERMSQGWGRERTDGGTYVFASSGTVVPPLYTASAPLLRHHSTNDSP